MIKLQFLRKKALEKEKEMKLKNKDVRNQASRCQFEPSHDQKMSCKQLKIGQIVGELRYKNQ